MYIYDPPVAISALGLAVNPPSLAQPLSLVPLDGTGVGSGGGGSGVCAGNGSGGGVWALAAGGATGDYHG